MADLGAKVRAYLVGTTQEMKSSLDRKFGINAFLVQSVSVLMYFGSPEEDYVMAYFSLDYIFRGLNTFSMLDLHRKGKYKLDPNRYEIPN